VCSLSRRLRVYACVYCFFYFLFSCLFLPMPSSPWPGSIAGMPSSKALLYYCTSMYVCSWCNWRARCVDSNSKTNKICGRSWPQLHFINLNLWIWFQRLLFGKALFGKETAQKKFYQIVFLGINESTPQTQSKVICISSKAEFDISFLNSILEKWAWKSGLKIDLATGVSISNSNIDFLYQRIVQSCFFLAQPQYPPPSWAQ